MSRLSDRISSKFRTQAQERDSARLAAQFDPAEDLTKVTDIPYLPDGDPAHLLDVYYPSDGQESYPVIVDIHGGALIYGNKELNCNFNYELARRGFAVVSINYRLMPQVNLADQLRDVIQAMVFLPDLAKQYPLDLSRLFLVGDSAGGLLAFLTAALLHQPNMKERICDTPVPVTPQALGLLFTMSETKRSMLSMVMAGHIVSDKKKEAFLNAPTSVLKDTRSLPPTWLMTSKEDFIRKESLGMKAALEKAAIPHEFVDYPKGTAGYPLEHVFPVSYSKYPESAEAIDRLCAFFKAQRKEGF